MFLFCLNLLFSIDVVGVSTVIMRKLFLVLLRRLEMTTVEILESLTISVKGFIFPNQREAGKIF